MGRWGGVISGSYRAPLAAARLSARDCSCMVTQPPSEQSAVSFPPMVVSATLTPGVPLPFGEPDLAIRSSACGAQTLDSQFLPTVMKQKMGSWTPRLTTISAALAYRYNTESTNTRTQIQHESASDPTRRSRASAPLTEGWAAPPPEAPDARSAPLCPGTVPKHPAYRWGARRSSRPRL